MTFAAMKDRFAAQNAALLGLSVDSNPSHIAWTKAMRSYQWKDIRNPEITFPIVADDFGNVARMYGMLMPTVSATKTVRNVFFIDPQGVIRAILVYPLTTGRNMEEIYRMLLALQAYDETGHATPANWMPGQPQLMPVPQTVPEAYQRVEQFGGACLDWYICFTQENMANANMAEPANLPANAVVPAHANIPMPVNMPSPPNVPAPAKKEPMPEAAMPKAEKKTPAPQEGSMASPMMGGMAAGMGALQPEMPAVPYQEIHSQMSEPFGPQFPGRPLEPEKKAETKPVGSITPAAMPKQEVSGSSIADENRKMFGMARQQPEAADHFFDYYSFTRSPGKNP